jgi:hypothetical protein
MPAVITLISLVIPLMPGTDLLERSLGEVIPRTKVMAGLCRGQLPDLGLAVLYSPHHSRDQRRSPSSTAKDVTAPNITNPRSRSLSR